MPIAITLRFDPVSATTVQEMWRTLAEQGIDTDREQLGYPAHITLAIYPDDAPVDVLGAALDQVTRNWRALPVTLSGFGLFPKPSAILWAAPVVTPVLVARHAAVHAALTALRVDPHYCLNAWVPHVTLSGALSDPGRALAALLPLWRPLTGLLDQVDLVRYRPVEVLQSLALPS